MRQCIQRLAKATLFGMLEAVGLSWKLSQTYPEKIKAVTAQEIQQAAQKYLIQKTLTVAEVVPLMTKDEEKG